MELPDIKLYTAAETAKALRISRSYLVILVGAGKIKPIRQGHRQFFREDDIAEYLLKCYGADK